MAPNLVVKPAFVRGKQDSFSTNSISKVKSQTSTRTENIIQNVYNYLLGSDYDVIQDMTLNSRETVVFEALKSVVNEFKLCYSDTMAELSGSLEVSPESVGSVFLGVSNELFCEGITWSKIATFLVFASEFAVQCLRKNLPETTVEDILDCLLKFVEDNLERWVHDHGGWEGVIDFSQRYKKKSVVQQSTSDAAGSGWAKSVLYGTVRMLGTLAHIANSTDPALSFPMHT